jgi:lipopolysaccharide/colanic/teichoic acid biosynthesis glycosyltransferase
MATLKSGFLPAVKQSSAENGPLAYFERRLNIPLVYEAFFVQMLRLERRRSERSGRPFVLVLIGAEKFHRDSRGLLFYRIATAITKATRETDVLGWYKQDLTMGLLLTELGSVDAAKIDLLREKISDVVRQAVDAETFGSIELTFRVFPQSIWSDEDEDHDSVLYPDVSGRSRSGKVGLAVKRTLDIVGSLIALIILSPVFLITALLVKCTSSGSVFFSQKRLGQYGREFSFFKFRTMYANSDPKIHREFVEKLIAGNKDLQQGEGMFKLKNDPRITPIGRFLRKSSLDELPQLFNVLLGQMSLVGPRPPLPYEYEKYQAWHRRRVLELKPGMTGLWQVEGRSRTTFDEMVRMDLKYAKNRTLWLDLKILFMTPRAVLLGRGAC